MPILVKFDKGKFEIVSKISFVKRADKIHF